MLHSRLQSFKVVSEYGTMGTSLDDFPDFNNLSDFEYGENQADTCGNSRKNIQQDKESGKEWTDMNPCRDYYLYPQVISVLHDKVIVNKTAM